jgi:hypothetical protein
MALTNAVWFFLRPFGKAFLLLRSSLLTKTGVMFAIKRRQKSLVYLPCSSFHARGDLIQSADFTNRERGTHQKKNRNHAVDKYCILLKKMIYLIWSHRYADESGLSNHVSRNNARSEPTFTIRTPCSPGLVRSPAYVSFSPPFPARHNRWWRVVHHG